METIYDQIGRVRAQLVDEADMVVAEAAGHLEVATSLPADTVSVGANALATVMRPVDPAADDTGALREFYVTEMRPFLQKPSRAHVLADPADASARFVKLRRLVPPSVEPAIADLESLCEEERQLLRQLRMHRVLHGWLIVHVPCSFALMALAVVHIIMALRY